MRALFWLELKIIKNTIFRFIISLILIIGIFIAIDYYTYTNQLYFQCSLCTSMYVAKYTSSYYIQNYRHLLPSMKNIQEYIIFKIVLNVISTFFVSILIATILLNFGKSIDIGLIGYITYYIISVLVVILVFIISLHFDKVFSGIISTILFLIPCVIVAFTDLLNDNLFVFLMLTYIIICIILTIVLFGKIYIERTINKQLK